MQTYTGSGSEPLDFDAFWHRTITEARTFEHVPTLTLVDTDLETIDVYDVRFPGFDGQPVAAWLRDPLGVLPLPAVIE